MIQAIINKSPRSIKGRFNEDYNVPKCKEILTLFFAYYNIANVKIF
ncbi:hypothetical protein ASZ90_017760 [hydrocarbon metagenome]|uniref:Uncharacterized protein n=1 Tax=hydrocarbon metagenome TaxID=938273 RepID=A0A0W8E8D5_9ZZZZ